MTAKNTPEPVSGETHWRCPYCDADTKWGVLTCSGCGYRYGRPSPKIQHRP